MHYRCPVLLRGLLTTSFTFPGHRENQDLFLDWGRRKSRQRAHLSALAESRAKLPLTGSLLTVGQACFISQSNKGLCLSNHVLSKLHCSEQGYPFTRPLGQGSHGRQGEMTEARHGSLAI